MSNPESDVRFCELCCEVATPLCGQLGIARNLCGDHLSLHLQLAHQAQVSAGVVPMSDGLLGAARRLEEFAQSMRAAAKPDSGDRVDPAKPREP